MSVILLRPYCASLICITQNMLSTIIFAANVAFYTLHRMAILKIRSSFKYFNLSQHGQNGRHFRKQQFQKHFLWMESWVFRFEFHCSLFLRDRWQKVSNGSGNGLAPNRWQAITRTNADQVPWRIYAALGGDELKLTILVLKPDNSKIVRSISWLLISLRRQVINIHDIGHVG